MRQDAEGKTKISLYKRIAYSTFLAVGVFLSLFAVWMFYQGPEEGSLIGFTLPKLSLAVIQGNVDGKVNIVSGRVVVIAFSPTDCGSCLEILITLNDLYQNARNSVPIVGIIDTPYRQAVWKLQQEYRLSFPLLYDSSSVIKKTFTDEWKPALILLNDGKIQKFGIVGAPESVQAVQDIMRVLVAAEEK